MYIYGTYRFAYTNTGNRYSISYYLDNELLDYKKTGVMSIDDSSINEEQYTGELAPGVKSLTRFFKAYYNENFVLPEHFEIVKNKMTATHYAIYLTEEEAKQWLRTNTNLEEEVDGTFLLRKNEEGVYEYLTIE